LKDNVKINNQIEAKELRVVNEKGENLGIFDRDEAIKRAEEEGLDLVLITAGAKPPIAKIIDFGKFKYALKKKEQKSRAHRTETKTLQIKIGTGEHDLSLKAKKASQFLMNGHRVKIDLYLRGRAKYLNENFLKERLDRILILISETHKIADGPKKSPKGISIIIEKGKK